MAKNVFPQTLRTWISDELGKGERGRATVNNHVMSVYLWPLQVYFLGTSYRSIGEPSDIVQGFFADRLARPQFFDQWQESGLALRRWLMNAFCFYLKEITPGGRKLTDVDRHDVADDAAEGRFLGAFVGEIVRTALREAHDACERQGLQDHWAIFIAHHYQDRSYEDVEKEFGVTAARAAVMARTAARKFRDAVREVLIRDGVGEEAVDEEIRELLEGAGS